LGAREFVLDAENVLDAEINLELTKGELARVMKCIKFEFSKPSEDISQVMEPAWEPFGRVSQRKEMVSVREATSTNVNKRTLMPSRVNEIVTPVRKILQEHSSYASAKSNTNTTVSTFTSVSTPTVTTQVDNELNKMNYQMKKTTK
jgi:hypothetical protein